MKVLCTGSFLGGQVCAQQESGFQPEPPGPEHSGREGSSSEAVRRAEGISEVTWDLGSLALALLLPKFLDTQPSGRGGSPQNTGEGDRGRAG